MEDEVKQEIINLVADAYASFSWVRWRYDLARALELLGVKVAESPAMMPFDANTELSALREDYERLLGERNFMWQSTSADAVNDYCSSLEWETHDDHVKTLVIGNVRAFASHLRGQVAKRYPNR